ncbi:MAG: BREX-1 system adenine-specific DNA-methyltransferase PglX [Bacteroidetes bacterium]|nr:BREX-1 system adenine-specific DNA-methyltransferase PglX [Bacteroidota bacterium]
MPVLSSAQRSTLEKTIIAARKTSEVGAANALKALAVHESEPYSHMSPEQRKLRNRLRSKGRLLGDVLQSNGKQSINKLSYELAYEYWHKMLFAAFLEANVLLMHPDGVAVSFEDVEELAPEEDFVNKWVAAAHYASAMLPAIFRVDDPLMQVEFSLDERIALESLLDGLDDAMFKADDALGWVYQFWQSEAKERINQSGDKIDGEKLPAVTQLFTEDYMVQFLIDNTIGAWWVSRNPGVTPPVEFEYLRKLEDGSPAAGNFEGWPDKAAELTCMDPSMGSGHFVVALYRVLVKLRMQEEGLGKEEATDKVIAENLHGLEIDPRCTQIAAFNLALTAWKFCGRYKELPEMNLACSGIAPKGKEEDWVGLVKGITNENDQYRMENGMRELFRHFQLAPELGSLLDPSTVKADMHTASFEDLKPALVRALDKELDEDQQERGVMAAGIASSGRFLSRSYTLQITNVPYLTVSKHSDALLELGSSEYPRAKHDLATIFLQRLIKLSAKGGSISVVIPQNWTFLSRYESFRRDLLINYTMRSIVKLGARAFQTPMYDFNVMLMTVNNSRTSNQSFLALDLSDENNFHRKIEALGARDVKYIDQSLQVYNPDARIVLEKLKRTEVLSTYADSRYGLRTSDTKRFVTYFWEIWENQRPSWSFHQSTLSATTNYGGRENMLFWQKGCGSLQDYANIGLASLQGGDAWGNKGVVVSLMGKLPVSLYEGSFFDNNCAVVWPAEVENLSAIWAYTSSEEFNEEVRKLDQALKVTNATLLKIPFDLDYWQGVADKKYPNGLPKPYSDDPTQWLFHGNPTKTENPLQVGLARLLGYRWPAETDDEMELADEARQLIAAIKAFDYLSDDDGIACIPSVNGEASAAERLRDYVQRVFGDQWDNQTLSQLLKQEGAKANDLEKWLRDEIFIQHCKVFNNRPFIWHIWDGRKDGFSALVNYHQLNKENLQKLIYTYLGDWIRQCKLRLKNGKSGADGQLAAANALREKLILILEGEPPYDIFVRWKPLEEQPIGWEPDLNDGVRMNIYPFMQAKVLRKNPPSIKWGKDRGKNPAGSHWGPERHNRYEDLANEYKLKDENGKIIPHLTNEVKKEAREVKENSQ